MTDSESMFLGDSGRGSIQGRNSSRLSSKCPRDCDSVGFEHQGMLVSNGQNVLSSTKLPLGNAGSNIQCDWETRCDSCNHVEASAKSSSSALLTTKLGESSPRMANEEVKLALSAPKERNNGGRGWTTKYYKGWPEGQTHLEIQAQTQTPTRASMMASMRTAHKHAHQLKLKPKYLGASWGANPQSGFDAFVP